MRSLTRGAPVLSELATSQRPPGCDAIYPDLLGYDIQDCNILDAVKEVLPGSCSGPFHCHCEGQSPEAISPYRKRLLRGVYPELCRRARNDDSARIKKPWVHVVSNPLRPLQTLPGNISRMVGRLYQQAHPLPGQ